MHVNMASDVSQSDGEMDSWEDHEDWTSTQWADPNDCKNVTPSLQSGSHQSNSINSHPLNLSAKSIPGKTDGSTVVKRMLLNDNKAGMEGLDKDKINQIIHEASKGSKFYENEQQKEEQMKRRIEEQRQKINQITSEQLKQGTFEADKLLEDYEQQRDLSHSIVHIDMDAFYAAVEMRDDPSLKNKPMAVGGNSMLSTSNYHARKFGVRAAMPGFIGKKLCPELVIVPLNFEKYTLVSKQVKAIIAEYDPNFCPMSLDEAYLDLTRHLQKRRSMPVKERTFICRDSIYADSRAHCKCDLNEIKNYYDEQDISVDKLNDFFMNSEHFQVEGDSVNVMRETKCLEKVGRKVTCLKCKKELPSFKLVTFGVNDVDAVIELRTRIEQKTTLTASAGVAPNMMLAKVCSDKNKPNGQYKIEPNRDTVMEFIKHLPTRKVSGIGKVSEAMLNAVGVHMCTDLYEKRGLLYHLYSHISFNYFMRICLGIGSTTVERDSERKSMSTERTFTEINRPADLYQKCEELCESLSEDMKSEQLKGKTVSIKIKTVKFEVRTRAHTVGDYTNDYKDILHTATELLKNEIQNCSPQPLRLRLMGVRMSNLLHESLCEGKKQNTIIGAFKRLSKQADQLDTHSSTVTLVEKLGTNYGILAETHIGIVKAHDVSAGYNEDSVSTADTGISYAGVNNDMEVNDSVRQPNDVVDHGTALNMDYINMNKTKLKDGNTVRNNRFVSGNEIEHETDQVSKANENPTEHMIDTGKTSGVVHSGQLNEKSSDQTKPFYERKNKNLIKKQKTDSCNGINEIDTHLKDGSVFVLDEGSVFVSDEIQIENNVILENIQSQEKDISEIYSPNVRKTRSGVKRTPVSLLKQKKRKGGKKKDEAVTYECPVCSLKILCESLQVFNEHVDNCLESGSNARQGVNNDNDDDTVIEPSKEFESRIDGDEKPTKDSVKQRNELGIQTGVLLEQSDVVGSMDERMAHLDEDDVEKKTCERVKSGKSRCLLEVEYKDFKTKLEEEDFKGSIESERDDTEIVIENNSIETVHVTTVKLGDISSPINDKQINKNTEYEECKTNTKSFKNESVDINDLITGHSSTDISNSVNEINKEDNKICDMKNDNSSVDKKATSKYNTDMTECNNGEEVNERKSETDKRSEDLQKDPENTEPTNDKLIDTGKDTIDNHDVLLANKTEASDVNNLNFTKDIRESPENCDLNESDSNAELVNEKCSKVIPLCPQVVVEKTNEEVKEKELVYPSTSMQSDERYHQMARSDAWIRKNLLLISDNIEGMTEEALTEESADGDEEQEGSLLVCPICNTEQRSADLTEFNSHVDMCLSRGAISDILKEQNSNNYSSLKRSRVVTPVSAKSAKRRKTAMPNISKSCRSIASFFQEK